MSTNVLKKSRLKQTNCQTTFEPEMKESTKQLHGATRFFGFVKKKCNKHVTEGLLKNPGKHSTMGASLGKISNF